MEVYTLKNGVEIPCLGFGTYKTTVNGDCSSIKLAIEAGYRYFDTASFYNTEEALGTAVKESGIPREEFFLVSKLWKTEMGYEETKKALTSSLECLQTDYLDGYLIHWPRSSEQADWKEECLATWRALEEAYEAGRVRAIGCSNFLPHHLDWILKNCRIQPMMNQLELHPGYMQLEAVRYCKEHDIVLQAWSPLGRLRVMDNKLIGELAEKYQVSKAQICLRFLYQQNIIPIPKASSLERMRENQDIFSFEIEQEDMYRLLCMPQCGWSKEYPDPELAEKINTAVV